MRSSVKRPTARSLTDEARKKMGGRIPLDTRKKILADVESGIDKEDISAKYGFSVRSIWDLMRHYRETGSLKPKPSHVRYTAEVRKKMGNRISLEIRQKIVADYETGASQREISNKYGFGEPSISRILKRYRRTGNPEAKRRDMSSDDFETMRQLILSNPDATMAEIWAKMGL